MEPAGTREQFQQTSQASGESGMPIAHSHVLQRQGHSLPNNGIAEIRTEMSKMWEEIGGPSSSSRPTYDSTLLRSVNLGDITRDLQQASGGGLPPDDLYKSCFDRSYLNNLHKSCITKNIDESVIDNLLHWGDHELLARMNYEYMIIPPLVLQGFLPLDRLDRFDSDSPIHKTLRIRLSDVKACPVATLDQISDILKNRPGEVSLGVKFLKDDGTPMDGIDAGGLSRQLISDLFEGLVKAYEVKFYQLSNGFSIPKSKDDTEFTAGEKLVWTLVGKILKFCIYRNFQHYMHLMIGPIFNRGFYEVLMLLAKNQGELTLEKKLELYKTLYEDDPHIQKQIESCIAYLGGAKDPEQREWALTTAFPDDELPEIVDDTTLRGKYEAFIQPYLQPMAAIADGMRAFSEPDGEAWFENLNATQLIDSLQGSLDKETLLNKFDFGSSVSEEKRDWIRQWILKASDKEISDFIKAITGSRTLGNRHLNFTSTHSSYACFHTCNHVCDIPKKTFEDYQEFIGMLKLSVKHALEEGFGSG